MQNTVSKKSRPSVMYALMIAIVSTALIQFVVFLWNQSPTQQHTTLSYKELWERYDATKVRYLALLAAQNPGVVLKTLAQDITKDPVVSYFCHEIVHEVGRAAYAKYNSFAEAMQYQSELCVSGYMHGVMEAAFSRTDDIGSTVTTIGNGCDALPKRSYKRWECYHGMGHGLMFFLDNDLPRSLSWCEQRNPYEAEACTNGVFMENFNTNQKIHPSRYLREDDPFYPCREQKIEYKSWCYMNAPIYYLNRSNNDYAGAWNACKDAELMFQAACYYGVGAQATRRNALDIGFLENICGQAGKDEKRSCISGVLSYLLGQYDFPSFEEARALCSQFSSSSRDVCKQEIVQFRTMFE